MLGRALGREFPEAERFTRAALDITDGVALRGALAPDTRLVLNAAADTRVDAAETDPHHVVVNVVAVGALAALCRKLDATLVHVSTDYVFSGKGIRPYREDDPVDPVNAYGRAKLMGERRAFEEGDEGLVLRTSDLITSSQERESVPIAKTIPSTPSTRTAAPSSWGSGARSRKATRCSSSGPRGSSAWAA